MRISKIFLIALMVLVTASLAAAQFKDLGYEVGVYGGVVQMNNESDGAKLSGAVEACVAYPLFDPLQAELGIGYRDLRGEDYHGAVMPLNLLLRFSPVYTPKWIPYAYAGVGLLSYDSRKWPETAPADATHNGTTGVIPLGVGLQHRLEEYFSLDVRGGFNMTFSEDVNPVDDGSSDSYLNLLVGLRVSKGAGDKDTDGDGIANKVEKQIGTDKRNPDTDGDGLNDGEEYFTYKTDPLNPDSDGDGLTDAAEIRDFKTDPLKDDTDGDGLKDGVEILELKTSAVLPDTDGDGLNDNAEVTELKTDPLKPDTDGDTLTDGDEVNSYKTDPLKMDSDGGTVNDDVEISRGSNPRNPSDDIPKIAVEIGKPIVLEGIRFKSGSAQILPESEKILNDVYETLRDNTQIVVEIHGHTDNTGSAPKNMKLSMDRAESVKQWLIGKGIIADRLVAKGFGPDQPVVPNDTADNRAKNRRIEFVRIK